MKLLKNVIWLTVNRLGVLPPFLNKFPVLQFETLEIRVGSG
jgi:hypothetical protein